MNYLKTRTEYRMTFCGKLARRNLVFLASREQQTGRERDREEKTNDSIRKSEAKVVQRVICFSFDIEQRHKKLCASLFEKPLQFAITSTTALTNLLLYRKRRVENMSCKLEDILLPLLTEDPVYSQLQQWYNDHGVNLNLKELFEGDAQRFRDFR